MGGTDKIKICGDKVCFLNTHKDWLYYINLSDWEVPGRGKLYRIKIDGTRREKLTDEDCEYLTIVGDWAYYLNKDRKIHKLNLRKDGFRMKYSNLNNRTMDGITTNSCSFPRKVSLRFLQKNGFNFETF